MEELNSISPKEKVTFKEHYVRIQYALEKMSEKRVRAPLSPIPQMNKISVLRDH